MLFDRFTIGFDEAERYRKSAGCYLRRNQWADLTVEVFLSF
jgi:hypothetical protein